MAYLVAKPAGSWEIRESASTPNGPRSRTLATFRMLSSEVIEHAQARSDRPLDAGALRRAALRAGAPLAPAAAEVAARTLIDELQGGRGPRRALRRALLEELHGDSRPSDNARAAAAWLNAGPERHGEALHDLLLLADRVPARSRPRRHRFPRIESR